MSVEPQGMVGTTGVASSLRKLEHSRECFAAEWRGRRHLVDSVQKAPVKGFPPKRRRFPPEGTTPNMLGLQMIMSSGVTAPRMRLGSSYKSQQTPTKKSLSQLLNALEAQPWKRTAPAPHQCRRPTSAGPLLVANQRGKPENGQTAPGGIVQQSPPKSLAVPAGMKPILTSCEKELSVLFATWNPPEQFEALFVTLLILVSPSSVPDEYFTWGSFRKWVRTFGGAAGFLQNIRSVDHVSEVSANRAVRHLVDHLLFPDKFNIGDEFYHRKFCPKFGRSFCQWLWDKASGQMQTAALEAVLAADDSGTYPDIKLFQIK